MTETGIGGEILSDAELIAAVRAGDNSAFAELYARHAPAARSVARQYASSDADADDICSDAFAKVFSVLQGGGGPDEAFRAYLFTVVRRLAYAGTQSAQRVRPTDDVATFESAWGPAGSVEEPTLAGFERTVVARAFNALPERWQAVLWYTEVEGLSLAEIGPLLGLSANGAAALAYRAREGLREAYLQAHLAAPPTEGCTGVADKLGAYVRGGLSRRDTRKVDEHLESCEECRALVAELGDVNHGMRAIVAPLVLGVAGTGALKAGGLGFGGAVAGIGAGVVAAGGTAGGATGGASGGVLGSGATAVGVGAGAVAVVGAVAVAVAAALGAFRDGEPDQATVAAPTASAFPAPSPAPEPEDEEPEDLDEAEAQEPDESQPNLDDTWTGPEDPRTEDPGTDDPGDTADPDETPDPDEGEDDPAEPEDPADPEDPDEPTDPVDPNQPRQGALALGGLPVEPVVVRHGEAATLSFDVSNPGTAPVQDVRVTLTAPDGVRLQLAPTLAPAAGTARSISCVADGSQCTVARLDPGDVGTVALQLLVDEEAEPTTAQIDIALQARGVGRQGGYPLTIAPSPARLAVGVPESFELEVNGTPGVVDIAVLNHGWTPAQNVEVSMALPPDVLWTGTEPDGWTCEAVDGGVDCARSSLPGRSGASEPGRVPLELELQAMPFFVSGDLEILARADEPVVAVSTSTHVTGVGTFAPEVTAVVGYDEALLGLGGVRVTADVTSNFLVPVTGVLRLDLDPGMEVTTEPSGLVSPVPVNCEPVGTDGCRITLHPGETTTVSLYVDDGDGLLVSVITWLLDLITGSDANRIVLEVDGLTDPIPVVVTPGD